jgi:hypothetical protein
MFNRLRVSRSPRSTRNVTTLVATLALAAATLGLGACESTRGSSGGRIDPYTTTESDRKSGKASIPAMLEFSDQVGESLAQDISEIDEIQSLKEKVVLELGSILNKTNTPTSDFEQLRSRVRGKIFASKFLRKQFMIVESKARMDAEKDRVEGTGGGKDLLQEGRGTAGTNNYNPNIVYLLQGDFFESTRGDRRQYYFEFKLTNLQTRQIVFMKSFDLGQKREHD